MSLYERAFARAKARTELGEPTIPIGNGNGHWSVRRVLPAVTWPRGGDKAGARHWSRRLPERVVRGERAVHAKLTEENVREIRDAYAHRYVTQLELADSFDVAVTTG